MYSEKTLRQTMRKIFNHVVSGSQNKVLLVSSISWCLGDEKTFKNRVREVIDQPVPCFPSRDGMENYGYMHVVGAIAQAGFEHPEKASIALESLAEIASSSSLGTNKTLAQQFITKYLEKYPELDEEKYRKLELPLKSKKNERPKP